MTTSDEPKNYRKVALERFHDALVLYAARRYSASLYMSGYVIEIGIKYKIFELGNTPWTEIAPQAILYAFAKEFSESSPPEKFNEMLEKIPSLGKDQKDTKNLSHVKTITESRFIADGKSPDGRPKLHNVRKFMEQSVKWYEVSKPNDRETKQLKKFYECREFSELYPDELNIKDKSGWSTNIRYKISQQEHNKEDVLKHLNLCVTFLQDVLEYGRNEIGEDFLTESADQQNKELY